MRNLILLLLIWKGLSAMAPLPNLDETDLLIIAEVVNLGPEPQSWSGRVATYQSVYYQVIKVMKGKITEEHVKIEHAVVRSSPVARQDRPGLSQTVFKPHRKLIVGAKQLDGRLIANYVVPWTEETELRIREAVAAKPVLL